MSTAYRCLLAMGLLASQLPALAATPENITTGEMALLPDYCTLTQTFTRDDPRAASVRSPARLLYERMGPSYLGLHHYCYGLIHVMRAKRAGLSQLSKRAMYTFAINEYRYAIENSTPDFVLVPEFYLRMGEAQLELQDYGSAIDSFTRSRTIKPDYWPPYVRWSAVLLRLGKQADALSHLEEGLRLMPSEPSLIEAYVRAGGTRARLAKLAAASMPAAAAASASAPAAATSASSVEQ